MANKAKVKLVSRVKSPSDIYQSDYFLWNGDVNDFLDKLSEPIFDLVVTSPPYNIGKEYEEIDEFSNYIQWQAGIIRKIIPLVKDSGSICWQVGNYVSE